MAAVGQKRSCPQRAECLANAVRSAVSVQVCAAAPPPAVADIDSGVPGVNVSKEEISRFLLEK